MSDIESSTVGYTANLPLSWKPVSDVDKTEQVGRLHSNLALLRGLASIEAAALTEIEHERDALLSKALERLEAKVDIAINLLARLTLSQTELPKPMAVTLRAQSIEWIDATPPELNQEVTLTVYLSPKLPEPLILQARIIEVKHLDTAYRCIAELHERDEEFEEWMIRTVFRYHRRELQARHQP